MPIALDFTRPFNNRIEVRDAKSIKITSLTLHFFEPVPLAPIFFRHKKKNPQPVVSKLLDSITSMILDGVLPKSWRSSVPLNRGLLDGSDGVFPSGLRDSRAQTAREHLVFPALGLTSELHARLPF